MTERGEKEREGERREGTRKIEAGLVKKMKMLIADHYCEPAASGGEEREKRKKKEKETGLTGPCALFLTRTFSSIVFFLLSSR